MRKIVLLAVVLIFIAGGLYLSFTGSSRVSQEPAGSTAEVGKQAPDFTLSAFDGTSYTLSELRGKVVLVNFWATWCPPCRAEMPSMEKLNRLMEGENFVILAINVEQNGRQAVGRFLESSPHSFPVLLDEQAVVQKRYGVYKFPETFVVRKDGIIDDKLIGAFDWASPDTVTYFRELL